MLTQNKISKNFTSLVIIGIAANALGLFNDILEPDGALYACIAKTIATNNDWVNLAGDGRTDWLDKPHFPFWITAVSYKIFGITAFAYKLPSFTAFLVSCFYTFKLTQKIFCTVTAQLTTLVYITSLHVILCNFDVRAEIYLTAFVTASIYYLYKALQGKWFINILLASIFTACAIMTKGIFVFVTIGSGFVVYWLLNKQFKEFINPKWYVYVALSLIFITPELYCLYQQFDAHPEKIVFDTTNVSGIKFFFWDSQFGRFLNNGPIKGNGDLLFFVHTTLWAFLPWAVYLSLAIIKNVRKLKSFAVNTSTIVYACALCSFLMFSVSKFQLPHYIVIIFPLLSIVVAKYLMCAVNSKLIVQLKNVLNVIFIVLVAVIVTITFVYKLPNYITVMLLLVCFSVIFFFLYKQKTLYNIVAKGICFSVLLSVFLNLIFYPNLLQYQAGMMAGKWQKKYMPNSIIPMYRCNQNLFDFYGNTNFEREINLQKILQKQTKTTVFTSQKEILHISTDSFSVNTIKAFPYFYITQLKSEFINYKTRATTLDSFAIIDVQRKY